MKIPIAKTVFTEFEFNNILKPLETGWVVQGPFVKEFEDKWSSFTGVKHSIAVSNCTTALHLSLAALGISFGDEVIVPAFTWVATANAVEALGAKPVFCDIDINTFNINCDLIEGLITSKTRAIIPVHLFGLPAEMEKIKSIAEKYNLFIVEDAACGFGSKFNGMHVGNFGNTGCFSFHPRKAITTGEGGMITTNDTLLANKLRAMRDHGAIISDHQRHIGAKPYLLPDFPYLGFNYRMTDIQGALGTTQMDRAEDIYIRRDYWAKEYDEKLKSIKWLNSTVVKSNLVHGYQAYVCMFNPKDGDFKNVKEINEARNLFMDYLNENGISTRPGTHSVHMLSFYSQKYLIQKEDYLNSFLADNCSIAFPLFPDMKLEEFNYIIEKIVGYKI